VGLIEGGIFQDVFGSGRHPGEDDDERRVGGRRRRWRGRVVEIDG
jgi:hypothetical protein